MLGSSSVVYPVLQYVSFVEIFGAKAIAAFVEAGLPENEATRYATFAFFTGVIATWLLGKLTHCMAHVAVSVRKHKVGMRRNSP